MAYNVVIQRSVAASNIDSYNRSAIYATDDLENGSVFTLSGYDTTEGNGEVWTAVVPTTATKGLWMAYSPEVVITEDGMGNQYVGLTKDPRAFTNLKGRVFDVFKLNVGDVIEMTCPDYTDVATSDYLNVGAAFELVPAAEASTTGAYLKKVGTGALKISTGAIGAASIPTYIYEVVVA